MSLSSVVSAVSDKVSSITGLVGTATGVISQAASLATATVSEIASSLPTTIGSFLTTTSDILGMSSITGALEKGTSQAIAKVKELLGSSGEAIANPISFVTKTVTDSVEGITTGLDAVADTVSGLSQYTSNELSSLASRAGLTSITNTDSLTTAISTIGNNLSTDLHAASTIVANISTDTLSAVNGIATTLTTGINTVVTPVYTAVNGITSEVNQVVADITGTTDYVLNGVAATTNNLTTVGTSLLPDVIQSSLTTTVSDTPAIAQATASLDNVVTNLSDIKAEAATSFLKVTELTTANYPTYSEGNVTNNTSTLSTSDITNLTTVAQSVCPNVSVPNLTEYRQAKDLYDTTLDLTSKNGLADTVQSLCDNTTYLDTRSKDILLSNTAALLAAGDIQTYAVIINVVGPAAIQEPLTSLRTLVSNMEKTPVNISLFKNLLTVFGVTEDSLFGNNQEFGTIKTLDAQTIVQLCNQDTSYVDSVISEEDRLLAQQVYVLYQ